MDNKGQLAIAHPPPQPTSLSLLNLIVFHGLIPILVPVFVSYKFITDRSFRATFPATTADLFSLVKSATIDPVSRRWYFQDATLLKRLWKLSSARAYIDKVTQQPHLEYQQREGFCGSATQMCTLKSFGIPYEKLPPPKHGESKPEEFAEHIAQIAGEHNVELSTTIVRGDVSYKEFLSALRGGLANDNVRIACNYLRSALTGFERYYPSFLIVGMYGGHFSPILGIIENDHDGKGSKRKDEMDDNPLVGIFDTNHKYNGAYLVPARRLYAAVHAVDVTANKERALVLVEKK